MDWHFLTTRYWNNTLGEYLLAAATFVAVVLVFLLVRRMVLARLRSLAQRTVTDLDDLAVELLGKIRFPEGLIVAFYVATRPLLMPGWADRALKLVVLVSVAYRVVTLLQTLAAYAVNRAVLRGEPSLTQRAAARNLSYLASFLIWLGGFLFVLSNLGVNITSFVAGLGIGGVAVALAAQAILGDFFSAVAIYLDKPFVVGDFIIVDDFRGTIESIGIKNTRIRSLTGELLIFPNSNLTSSRVRNYKDMAERRVVVKFSAAYGTPAAKLEAVPALIKAAVSRQAKARFDRAHLSGLGESSVDFELVYYLLSPDFNQHMDVQQAVILDVLRAFEKEGIEVPFPTRTLYMRQAA